MCTIPCLRALSMSSSLALSWFMYAWSSKKCLGGTFFCSSRFLFSSRRLLFRSGSSSIHLDTLCVKTCGTHLKWWSHFTCNGYSAQPSRGMSSHLTFSEHWHLWVSSHSGLYMLLCCCSCWHDYPPPGSEHQNLNWVHRTHYVST